MTVGAIEAELREAELRGYHQSDCGYMPDLAGVAMPLPLPERRLAIVVAGPVSRCLGRRAGIAGSIREALRRFMR